MQNVIKRIVHIVFSVAMALLLVFGGVSKEYLHLFTGHTDTTHCNHERDGLYFENEHHHCDFLSFTLPPFVHDAAVYIIPAQRAEYIVHTAEAVTHLVPRTVASAFLRGPPVLAA